MSRDKDSQYLINKYLQNNYKKNKADINSSRRMSKMISDSIRWQVVHLNPNIKNIIIPRWGDGDLLKAAFHLLSYYQLMCDKPSKQYFNQDYLKFMQINKWVIPCLHEHNPFFLHTHIIQLHNTIQNLKNELMQKKNQSIEILESLKIYYNEMNSTAAILWHLDVKNFGAYLLYLEAMVGITIANCQSDENIPFFYDLTSAKNYYFGAYQAAQKGQEIESKMQDTVLFYCLGNSLFTLSSFNSFADIKLYLKGLSIGSVEDFKQLDA